jgi:hypothetical protein
LPGSGGVIHAGIRKYGLPSPAKRWAGWESPTTF